MISKEINEVMPLLIVLGYLGYTYYHSDNLDHFTSTLSEHWQMIYSFFSSALGV